MKKRKRGKKGKKKDSFVWGFVFLGFAVGLLILAVLVRYGGLGGYVPGKKAGRVSEVPVEVAVPELPRVAIVIDDLGHDLRRLRDLLEVDAEITVAVIPHLKYSRDVSREAHLKGWEVLLHLPMEPKDSVRNDPGKGALLTSMRASEVRAQVVEDLGEVPHAAGINNHMGSRFTENETLMRAVLDVVKARGMFFLDSRTTPGSVAGRLLTEMGVKGVERNVFLDNTRSPEYIRGQIRELISIARKNGKAVAIGHPYPETIETLRGSMETLHSEGIEVVRLSELIE
jgi:polysaccharide deacetylase 2 family uncharacterized protein YibQ